MAQSPTTAATIGRGALLALKVLDPADTLSAAQGAQVLEKLNDLLGQWAIQGLTIPSISRVTHAMTAGKGSTTDPYLIGVGGDISIERPIDLRGIGTYLTSVTPNVEIPRGLLTPDQWQMIPVKDLPGVLFTSAFYNPTTAANKGELYLWPVPNNTTYTLVLYLSDNLAECTSLNASYYVAPGYTAALKYQLALELADDFGAEVTPMLERNAARAFANIKRNNATILDMQNDFAAVGRGDWGYNINTGNL